jgi:hypothetical protein
MTATYRNAPLPGQWFRMADGYEWATNRHCAIRRDFGRFPADALRGWFDTRINGDQWDKLIGPARMTKLEANGHHGPHAVYADAARTLEVIIGVGYANLLDGLAVYTSNPPDGTVVGYRNGDSDPVVYVGGRRPQ